MPSWAMQTVGFLLPLPRRIQSSAYRCRIQYQRIQRSQFGGSGFQCSCPLAMWTVASFKAVVGKALGHWQGRFGFGHGRQAANSITLM